MKFLALALCVCAASAATFNRDVGTWPQPNFAKATAEVSGPTVVIGKTTFPTAQHQVTKPVVHAFAKSVVNQREPTPFVAKTVVTPVVQPFAKTIVQPVVQPFTKTVAEPVVHATAHASTGPVFKSVKVENSDADASVLRSETDVNAEGFNFAYETSNGIAAASTGTLRKVDNVDTLVVEGQYQYISPEGLPIQLSYVANEYGYQPKSDILPVGPPVPVAIARALEYIAAHPPKTVKTN